MSRPDQTTLDPGAPFAAGGTAEGRLLALYEIGRQLLEQKQRQDVLRAVMAALVQHLQPDHACVLELHASGGYVPLATHALALEGPPEEWPLSRTVLARARETGLAVLGADVPHDQALSAARSVQRLQIRSVMCVPLGRPLRGMVYVDSRTDRRSFTGDDLAFLTAIALYASLALDRAYDLERATEALDLSDARAGVLQDELLRHEIVGAAPALLSAFDAVKRFARAGARVLLRGETGTGKELFARAYAAHSPRAGRPYVPVPIPALAPTLVESELFGHVRGAFTEAARDKKGRLELAHGGVLFLDEVGDIEPQLQAKLLRFLDSGELVRVGDTASRNVDALVVSATHRPIESDELRGTFRADLLARLGHVVRIPPLRERTEDIPLLVDHFLERYRRGGRRKQFTHEALQAMAAYGWPMNVRELQHVVERAIVLVDGPTVDLGDLPEEVRRGAPRTGSSTLAVEPGAPRALRDVVALTERNHILRVLEYTEGNRRRAAEILQISADTLYKRLEEFGLHRRG